MTMEFLNQIFSNWTAVIMSDTILLTFAFVILALIILIFIDAFK